MMLPFDENIFCESQLYNDEISWELLAQPWAEEGVKVNAGSEYTVPVMRGIIQEASFGAGGTHSFDGDNGLLGTMRGMLGKGTELLNSISTSASVVKGGAGSFMSGYVNKLADTASNELKKDGTLGQLASKAYDSAGSQFISALDYVSVFKGTSLDIAFPPLEARMYHNTFVENGRIIGSNAYMRKLLYRFVGGLVRTGVKDVDNLLGIQSPPNDYMPHFGLIDADNDVIVQGTFALRFGPYTVRNLLVVGFSYNVSTFKVREGKNHGLMDSTDIGILNEPLYVDIRVDVRPATYISRDTLLSIMKLIPQKR